MTAITTVVQLLERHEGREARPYPDTLGKLTVAVGWNLDDVPLPDQVIDLMRDIAIARAREACAAVFGRPFLVAGEARQAALISMAFMGEAKLRQFVRLRAAVVCGDWDAAAAEARDSRWATQVQPERVEHVTSMLRAGAWPA